VPEIRPFRALRYHPDVVADPGRVVAPPYDVIDAERHARLLARDPRNAVRLDLPTVEAGDEPDDRYRRAARTLAAWRSDGTLRKDPRTSVYVYEQAYRVPGTDEQRIQRGFFAVVRLEPFGTGILPHERTMTGPKEDRYKLLRATGLNTSPIVALYEDRSGESRAVLDAATTSAPTIDVVDDDGVEHRLWVITDTGDADGPGARLRARASDGALVIADGHHRYETALRYRDERRMTRSCEEDPPFDFALMLLLEATGTPLTVLPTHRLVRGLDDDGASLLARAGELFEVSPVASGSELASRFSAPRAGGEGRFGLWTRRGGALLVARRAAFAPLLASSGTAVRSLDVSLLGAALDRLAGIGADAVTAGERVTYTKSAAEAVAAVDEARDGVDAAFLLESTPVASIVEVARAGDVMPQKSTYFYPKALTGLVLNPHEW
jgi:uncharacterized protein (DUF1015 family)